MALSRGFTGPSALFGTELTDAAVFEPPRSAIPAGFDSIVQISTSLLHRTLAANLARWNLNPLSARVPYDSELVSPDLRALVQPLLKPRHTILEGSPYLEVQVLDPTPQALNWPTPPDIGVVTGGPTAAAHTVSRFGRKMIDLTWSLEVSLFRPKTTIGPVAPVATTGSVSAGPGGIAPGRGGLLGGIGTLPVNNGQIIAQPPPLPEGSRTTLAQGTAAMSVPTELVVNAPLYQFRLLVNFEGAQPSYTSHDPVMLEFLQTDLASSLLAQAAAPLLNQFDVGLSPTIALAGSLTPTQVTQAALPALHVNDMVVRDDKGQVVTFCVSLDDDSHGAFSMVTSFLAGHDFAYYVSDKVFSPVMKGLWRANAIHTPVVSDVPVEMPVEEGSDEIGIGRARVQVNLSGTLNDVGLVASTDHTLGDPLRIVSEQTVRLLALWTPQGTQVNDLGDLAKPTVEPFALSVQMFDNPASTQHTIPPPLKNLLAAMFVPLFFPMIERYDVLTVSGFSSSPLRALVARWTLPMPANVVTAPISGLLSTLLAKAGSTWRSPKAKKRSTRPSYEGPYISKDTGIVERRPDALCDMGAHARRPGRTAVSNNPPSSRFYSALASAPPAPAHGPVNAQAIQEDRGLVLEKATSLLGYQQYLTQARSWKAARNTLPAGFEGEVQAQAVRAVADSQALAAAALRMTSQFKQAGEVDRMLSGWVAAIGQSGPVQTADLLADLENQTSVRQTLQAEGVTDEIWSNLVENLKKVDARLFVKDGKFAAELKVAGQDKPRSITFAPSATGMPQTLHDLLRRGSFERLSGHYAQYGSSKLHLLPGPERDLEVPDVVLAGAILSVQSMAEHSRGLQDAGLAKYAGSAPLIIWAVASLAALAIGYWLEKKYCKNDGNSPSAACIAGTLLFILGLMGLGVLLMGAVAALMGPASDSGCATGVMYYSPIDGSTGCGEKSLP
jgi:hypothetical protein